MTDTPTANLNPVNNDADEPSKKPETKVDLARIERAMREVLAAVGEDPDREGIQENTGPSSPHVR